MTQTPEMANLLAEAELKVAIALHQADRPGEARRHYEAVLELRPDTVPALCNLGVILLGEGLFAKSEDLLRKAVELAPSYAPAMSNLGLVLHRLDRDEEALTAFRRTVDLEPHNATAHHNLGKLLKDLERYEEALQPCRAAVVLEPEDLTFLVALGLVLWNTGRFEDSAGVFQRAVDLSPEFIEARIGLVSAKNSLGCHLEALKECLGSIAIAPDNGENHLSLGITLRCLGRDDEAEAAFRKAILLMPDNATAHGNLADMLMGRRDFAEAMELFARAVALKPDLWGARARIAQNRQILCDWTDPKGDWRTLREIVANGRDGVDPFAFLSIDSTLEEQKACAELYFRKVRTAAKRKPAPSGPAAQRAERIRLGYLSSDFHEHPVCRLVIEMLERHDRARFEVTGYSCDAPSEQPIRRRVVNALEHFVDLRELSHKDAAKRIRDDGIDILIDLSGYTGKARSQIVAERPAPIAVSFLGYPGSMGTDAVDYIIADSYLAPTSHQPFYTERIVHLPVCYQPSDSGRSAALSTRAACSLPGDGVVLACLNNFNKFTPEMFDIWMRVLKAAPSAVLWLRESPPVTAGNLRREAGSRGVDPERLLFLERVPYEEFLGRLALADLFLDCYPFNAGATANDALWMGLPILTCSGETYVSRMAGSLLNAVGMPELIAHSLKEYEALALDLVAHPERLARMRRELVEGRASQPLFDMARFTRDIETAYVRMLEIDRAGKGPQAFAVSP